MHEEDSVIRKRNLEELKHFIDANNGRFRAPVRSNFVKDSRKKYPEAKAERRVLDLATERNNKKWRAIDIDFQDAVFIFPTVENGRLNIEVRNRPGVNDPYLYNSYWDPEEGKAVPVTSEFKEFFLDDTNTKPVPSRMMVKEPLLAAKNLLPYFELFRLEGETSQTKLSIDPKYVFIDKNKKNLRMFWISAFRDAKGRGVTVHLSRDGASVGKAYWQDGGFVSEVGPLLRSGKHGILTVDSGRGLVERLKALSARGGKAIVVQRNVRKVNDKDAKGGERIYYSIDPFSSVEDKRCMVSVKPPAGKKHYYVKFIPSDGAFEVYPTEHCVLEQRLERRYYTLEPVAIFDSYKELRRRFGVFTKGESINPIAVQTTKKGRISFGKGLEVYIDYKESQKPYYVNFIEDEAAGEKIINIYKMDKSFEEGGNIVEFSRSLCVVGNEEKGYALDDMSDFTPHPLTGLERVLIQEKACKLGYAKEANSVTSVTPEEEGNVMTHIECARAEFQSGKRIIVEEADDDEPDEDGNQNEGSINCNAFYSGDKMTIPIVNDPDCLEGGKYYEKALHGGSGTAFEGIIPIFRKIAEEEDLSENDIRVEVLHFDLNPMMTARVNPRTGVIVVNKSFVSMVAFQLKNGYTEIKLYDNQNKKTSDLVTSQVYSIAIHEIRGHIKRQYITDSADPEEPQRVRGRRYRDINIAAITYYWALAMHNLMWRREFDKRIKSFFEDNPQLVSDTEMVADADIQYYIRQLNHIAERQESQKIPPVTKYYLVSSGAFATWARSFPNHVPDSAECKRLMRQNYSEPNQDDDLTDELDGVDMVDLDKLPFDKISPKAAAHELKGYPGDSLIKKLKYILESGNWPLAIYLLKRIRTKLVRGQYTPKSVREKIVSAVNDATKTLVGVASREQRQGSPGWKKSKRYGGSKDGIAFLISIITSALIVLTYYNRTKIFNFSGDILAYFASTGITGALPWIAIGCLVVVLSIPFIINSFKKQKTDFFKYPVIMAVLLAALSGTCVIIAKRILSLSGEFISTSSPSLSVVATAVLTTTVLFCFAYLLCPTINNKNRLNPSKQEWSVFRKLPLRDKLWAILNISVLSLLGPYSYYGALAFIGRPEIMSIIVTTDVIFALCLSFIILRDKEKHTPKEIAMKTVGLLVVVGAITLLKCMYSPIEGAEFKAMGLVLAVAAAIFYGAQRIFSKKILNNQGTGGLNKSEISTMLVRMGYFFGFIVSLITATAIFSFNPSILVFEESVPRYLIFAALSATIFMSRWRFLYRVQETKIKQSRLEPILATAPIFTIIGAYILNGFNISQLISDWPLWLVAMVVVSVVFFMTANDKKKKIHTQDQSEPIEFMAEGSPEDRAQIEKIATVLCEMDELQDPAERLVELFSQLSEITEYMPWLKIHRECHRLSMLPSFPMNYSNDLPGYFTSNVPLERINVLCEVKILISTTLKILKSEKQEIEELTQDQSQLVFEHGNIFDELQELIPESITTLTTLSDKIDKILEMHFDVAREALDDLDMELSIFVAQRGERSSQALIDRVNRIFELSRRMFRTLDKCREPQLIYFDVEGILTEPEAMEGSWQNIGNAMEAFSTREKEDCAILVYRIIRRAEEVRDCVTSLGVDYLARKFAREDAARNSQSTEEGMYQAIRVEFEDRGIDAGDKLDRIIDAMRQNKRENFVPPESRDRAYTDYPIPIAMRQPVSQPFTVAFMTYLLGIERGDERILEIGTCSGWQASILASMVPRGKVCTVERLFQLFGIGKVNIENAGHTNVEVIHGDGTAPILQDKEDFDCIIVTAAAPEVPQPLIDKLKEGGRIVMPVGNPRETVDLRVGVKRDGQMDWKSIMPRLFVPLVSDAKPDTSKEDAIKKKKAIRRYFIKTVIFALGLTALFIAANFAVNNLYDTSLVALFTKYRYTPYLIAASGLIAGFFGAASERFGLLLSDSKASHSRLKQRFAEYMGWRFIQGIATDIFYIFIINAFLPADTYYITRVVVSMIWGISIAVLYTVFFQRRFIRLYVKDARANWGISNEEARGLLENYKRNKQLGKAMVSLKGRLPLDVLQHQFIQNIVPPSFSILATYATG